VYITEFLTARYDEEQRAAEDFRSRDWVARGATVRSGPRVQTAGPALYSTRMMGEPWPDEICVPLSTEERPDDFWTLVNLHGTTGKFESEMRHAEYIAYWDPARVLADIAAKRRIIGWCREVVGERRMINYGTFGCLKDDPEALAVTLAMETLRNLAAPYAEHPDFQPEWRIDA
jgi:hypothetical protein